MDGKLSWEAAFLNHRFTPRQSKLMQNFNLRYECLDARDDFSAKRKAAESSRFLANRMDFDVDMEVGDSDVEHEVLLQKTKTLEDRIRDAFENQSHSYVENQRRRYEIDCLTQELGMAYDSNATQENPHMFTEDEQLFTPDVYRTPSGWKAVVKSARETLLKSIYQRTAAAKTASRHIPAYLNRMLGNQIQLLDEKWFLKEFKAQLKEVQNVTEDIARSANLNTEQDRAFRIIVNHAASLAPEQLKMYIGGMAGTGKSRVVHAVKKFFELRNEEGRYVVIAPTGTAAAQLNGSTYHSLLGINDSSGDSENRNSQTALRNAQERLRGVEYIIFDEISMVPCHDLYRISARLCEIKNKPDEIFGGLNVILLGDFAQLSPVGGRSLYDGLAMKLTSRSKVADQEGFLGRAIWHQFTTVVMLVQNMRQLNQSPRDVQFRQCLVNMRYGMCTTDDINFLTSLIVRPDENIFGPNSAFRHAAIITRYNAQKDRLNEIGVQRFARDAKQKLYEFFSEDSIAHVDDSEKKRKRRKYVRLSEFAPRTQERLWSLPPSATSKHVPGRLLICKGLPVLIRNNDATELCITKGQDATVVGWDSRVLPCGREALNTVFVKLINPPKNVQFDGLPLNVVPLPTQLTSPLIVQTPSGQSISIKRWQVPILPFFAMTDYTSQGKTRSFNLVHLKHSPSHQAMYTALSRSATADGTAIMDGFDPSKITSGMSGYLRQEFRELEVLNKMTEFRYLQLIPHNAVTGIRSTTLSNYNALKQNNICLRVSAHPALQMNGEDNIRFEDDTPVLLDENINKSAIMDRVKSTLQTKAKNKDPGSAHPAKRLKTSPSLNISIEPIQTPTLPSTDRPPTGPLWDSTNYSCSYDSLIFVLSNLWKAIEPAQKLEWKSLSNMMNTLCNMLESNEITLNDLRDNIRSRLHEMDATAFPMGETGVDIDELALALAGNNRQTVEISLSCSVCSFVSTSPFFKLHQIIYPLQPNRANSSSLKDQWVARENAVIPCPRCMRHDVTSYLQHEPFGLNAPPLIFCPMLFAALKADDAITLRSMQTTYSLRGMIYFGSNHFTAIFRDNDGRRWHHDGMLGEVSY